MVAGSQAQLELRKVSLHVVEIGKGLGIMKRCGHTLETCVLLSQVGEHWVRGGHTEPVIPIAVASMSLLQLAPTGDPSPQPALGQQYQKGYLLCTPFGGFSFWEEEFLVLPWVGAIHCPKSGCPRAVLSPGTLGEAPSCLFQLAVAPRVPWLVAVSLQSPHPSSHCLPPVSFLLSPIRMLVLGFRAHLNPG